MGNSVITLIQMTDRDMVDFVIARDRLKAILDRHLDPVWTFKDKPLPNIEWEGVYFEPPKADSPSGY